jgi:pSer/pThr/pTyr-binding forkhead associated (FHA) protein
MGNEYKPTQRIDDSGRSYGAGDAYGSYNAPVGQPGANKTMRLRQEPPSFAWLVLIDGIHAGHIFRLRPDSTVVGRDPASCDVVLDDPAVSRQHVKIRVDVDDEDRKVFVIHDLATENGTQVNDEDIFKHTLTDGDRILIGQSRLVFKQVEL